MNIRLSPFLAVFCSVFSIINTPVRADLVPSDSLVELRAAQAYTPACECINSDRNEEAIRLFTIALGCPQKRCWAYANRARAYLRCGRLNEAVLDVAAALAIANDDLDTYGPSAWRYEQRAWVYVVASEIDEKSASPRPRDESKTPNNLAAADLAEALALDPDRAQALTWQVYVSRRIRDWDGMISACSKLLARDPTDFGCCLQRAYAYQEKLSVEEALEDCNVILNRMPLERETLRLRAWIYTHAGLFDEAWLKKGLALHDHEIAQRPGIPTLYEARALIHFHMGHAETALLDVEKALHCDDEGRVGKLPLTSYLHFASMACASLSEWPIREGDHVSVGVVVTGGVMPILDRLCLAAPDQGEFFLMRAWAQAAIGSPEEGQDDYLRAIQLGVTLNDDRVSNNIQNVYENPTWVKIKPASECHETRIEREFKKDPVYWATADTEAPVFNAATSPSTRTVR